jgi:outer membrane protein
MNKAIKGIAVIVLFIMAGSANAQNYKFGHINTQEILMALPQRDSAEAKLKKYVKEMQDMGEELQVEFNKKQQDYLQKKATLTDATREVKERELGTIQQRLQELQQDFQANYQNMQEELLKPLYEKINNSIKKVAKANGFTYVFEVNALMYYSDQSIDVGPLVKKDLGITK